MKSILKRKNLIILGITAVITLIVAFFCISTTYANAFEVFTITDSTIEQVNDASILKDLDESKMCFTFNYNKGTSSRVSHTKTEFLVELYRVNLNIYFDNNAQIALSNEEIKELDSSKYSLVDSYKTITENAWYTSKPYHKAKTSSTSKTIDGKMLEVEIKDGCLYAMFKPESKTVGYFVKVTETVYHQSFLRTKVLGFLPFYRYTDIDTHNTVSEVSCGRSYSYTLESYLQSSQGQQREEYEDEFEKINTATSKNITVEYLEQIGTSSFATKKTITVNTLVYPNNTLDIKQLESSMNVQSLDIFGTITNNYIYDVERNVYTLIYAKDVRLASKTVDGNTVNQFLDINKSFYDFYFPMKQNGIINDDLYEWFFAQIRKTNKSLQTLTYNEKNVYGYWGYAVVPETYSLNGIISDLFDGGTVYKGKLVQYTYKSLLTLDGYNALLRDYQYPWLSRVWNDGVAIVAGTVANHVLIVSEPNAKETVVSQNGSTDADNDKGLIRNETENIISNIGDKIGGFFGNTLKKGKSIIYGLIIGAVAILAIYIIVKEKRK